MDGSCVGSSPESGIAKTTDPTSTCGEHESCGDGGGGGVSGCAADGKGEEGEATPGDDAGCDQGRTTEIPRPPQPDGINGSSMKSEDKVAQEHADAAVAPVASTSFKRSGGTGSGSRRTAQKRVVTVPISEIGDGVPRPRSRSSGAAAGEGAPPPSDSWTWRKYGQKPIKGSPYPRGYYRCSSSKGCPARKQVERSRADPNMLVVTYASDHNHPWPVPRNGAHHNASRQSAATQPSAIGLKRNPLPSSTTDEEGMEVDYEIAPVTVKEEELIEEKIVSPQQMVITRISTTTSTTTNSSTDKATTSSPSLDTSSADNSLSGASDDSATLIPPLAMDDLCSTWFPVVDDEISLCSATADTAAKIMIPFSYDDLRADLMGNNRTSGYSAEDDDDSLFAGLGELPEFSLVFRRGMLDADYTSGW